MHRTLEKTVYCISQTKTGLIYNTIIRVHWVKHGACATIICPGTGREVKLHKCITGIADVHSTQELYRHATTLPLDLFVDSLACDVLGQPVKCQTVHIATYHFGVCLTLVNKLVYLPCLYAGTRTVVRISGLVELQQ